MTVLVVGVMVSWAGSTAGAAAKSDRIGAAPVIPLSSAVSALPASMQLHVTVSMRPQDPSGLQALATSISTPGSTEFRHDLTVAQFADRFGASASAISAVESQLTASGLTVGDVPANHLTIPASGTAAQIEQAFSVSMQQVKLASGRTAFANAQAPALPASVAQQVEGIVGLDDLNQLKPAALRVPGGRRSTGPSIRATGAGAATPDLRPQVMTGGPQPCTDATDEQSSFDTNVSFNSVAGQAQTADQIAAAYSFAPIYQAGDLGAGQTVALYELEPYDPTDIATYQSCYGTSVPITNVPVAGATPTCTNPCPDGGDGEAALDIEQVIGLAPKANVLVYDAPNSFQGAFEELSSIVSDDRAQEISTSWGVCESVIAMDDPGLIQSENTQLEEAATQGQAFFSSSGDSGAEDCSQQGGGDFSMSAEDPSAQPFATGVGGTTLTGDGPPAAETVWNDGPNSECNCGAIQGIGGTGGGISNQWTMPSYQSAAAQALGVTNANSSATPCGGGGVDCREIPDVSADGDPMTGYVIFDAGNWDVLGGTSASAPLWAAYTALVNASAACRGQRVGFANPILYQLAASNYAANFNDVTAASPYTGLDNNDTFDGAGDGTDVDDMNHLFPMRTGYDMATGLGSPIGSALAASLCAIRSPVYSVSVTNPGSQSAVVGNSVALAVQGIDSGGLALSYAASGLPAGLSINSATGTISGTPTAAGSSTVTVTAADTFTNTGATEFSWTVTSPPPPPPVAGSPVVSGVSLGGLATRKAKLKFTVDAGSNAPALHAVRIALPSGLGFVSKHKTLLKGISVQGSKFTAQLVAGKLTLTFSGPVQQLTITVGPPATNVTKGLATEAKHPKHKTVKVTVTAIDAAGLATAIPELLRL